MPAVKGIVTLMASLFLWYMSLPVLVLYGKASEKKCSEIISFYTIMRLLPSSFCLFPRTFSSYVANLQQKHFIVKKQHFSIAKFKMYFFHFHSGCVFGICGFEI